MDNIEHIFEEFSKDCVKMLETRFYRGFKYKGIILIGEQQRCEEFLKYFNTSTNNIYGGKIIINPDDKIKGKAFYPVHIDNFYDLRTK
mgnify:FL=1